jgi:hypothetical protein
MQGIQWTSSPLAQICIHEFATNFYQGWFSCWAIAINLLAYVYTALWFNATTRKVFIIQSSCANASHISSRLLCQTCVHMHFIGLATNTKWQQKLSRSFEHHIFFNFSKFVGMCFTRKLLSSWTEYVLHCRN